jgi:hypothetical protein
MRLTERFERVAGFTAMSYAIGMPRGLKGKKRPADVIGAAVMVGRIATGEIPEKRVKIRKRPRSSVKPAKKAAAR